MEEVLDSLLGKKIKVLFRDGDSVRCIRGKLSSVSSDFVKICTLSNEFFINRTEIIKIQKGDSGENGRK